jgi:hypothetical protein
MSSTHIPIIKTIDFYVKRFHLIGEVQLKCFSYLESREDFLFQIDFEFLNLFLRPLMNLSRCL